ALRPYTTLVIAEDSIQVFPFDLSHVIVRKYHHLGEDIGYDEVMRFREVITTAIKTILATQTPQDDSPVSAFLKGLKPPAREMAESASKGKGDTKGGADDKSKEEIF